MGNLQKKFSILFSITGIKTDILPGISIAFWFVYALLFQFQNSLLAAFNMQDMDSILTDLLLLGIVAVLLSIVLWFISGKLLDPIYDWMYSVDGMLTKSKGTTFIIFMSGFELDKFRKLARKKLTQQNNVYTDPNISIYSPIMDTLSSDDKDLYENVNNKLQISKTFRNAILPLLTLIFWLIYINMWGYVIIAFLVLIIFFAISFEYRASHSLQAYRWYYVEAKKI